ncbi:MAG: acyltransferase [Saprospiraceae bacterium]|nr:acyltransferase [Saprospiraceae bacterium]
MPNRTLWVDYLRSFITVLVVAHHASLAYTTFAYFDTEVYIRSSHPVVDTQRWVGLDIFSGFNDTFFMALMFLIGGLFLVRSISKKGVLAFSLDRLYRLLIPFLLLGTLLMLLAYLPSFYLSKGTFDISGHIADFFTIQAWPVGPPWFLWLLFAFNLAFAVTFPWLQQTYSNWGQRLGRLQKSPFLFFGFWWLLTMFLYVPMAVAVGAETWTGIGPFDFQLSRLFLYSGYFFFGVVMGTIDFNGTLFAKEETIVRQWWVLGLIALLSFGLWVFLPTYLRNWVENGHLPATLGWITYHSLFALSCTASSLVFLSAFKALISKPSGWWDSLSENAYLIYLLHYAFISWSQFLLLDITLSPGLKFIIVFGVALGGSWWLSTWLRKINIIRKYL